MVSSSVVRLAGFGWQAEVLPAYGMNLICLARSGSELLRTPEGKTQLRREPQVYGMPLLLPPNRTAGGAFTFQGTTYHLPINEPVYGNHIHGSLARMPFRVTEQTATSVTGFYENRGECYPFPFAITVTHCLTETGTQHLFTLCNTGPKTMPLAFGLHIAFRAKPFFAVPIGQRWEVDERYIPTGRLLPLTSEETAYRDGSDACSGKLIRGFYTAAGHTARIGGLCMNAAEPFNQWVLWNGDGTQDFICIEPMSGAVNALNSGVGLVQLQPGEAKTYTVRLYPWLP